MKSRSRLSLAVIMLFIEGIYFLSDQTSENDILAFLLLIFGLILFGRER